MPVNFDEIIDRHNTGSVKWHQNDDMIEMWIADMDFKSAEPIRQTIKRMVEHGIFGYSHPTAEVYQSIINWHQQRYGLALEKENILFSTGVVTSLALIMKIATDIGDAVLVNDPVYAPFFEKTLQNNRKLITSRLLEKEQRYYFDFADIEKKIRDNEVKLFILCNPHNPGGRVWSKEELQTILNICIKYDVAIISDEIHQDLTLDGHTFTPLLTIAKGYEHNVVSLTSVTKSFNVAGIRGSMIFAKDKKLIECIRKRYLKSDSHDLNLFAYPVIQSAYEEGGPWLKEAKAYIQRNIDFSIKFLENHLPKIKIMRPEASYLIWFDCSAYCDDNQKLYEKFRAEKIELVPGLSYGDGGDLRMRVNVATPRPVLIEGLYRIESALSNGC